jgi:hypothetical protein
MMGSDKGKTAFSARRADGCGFDVCGGSGGTWKEHPCGCDAGSRDQRDLC